MKIAIDLPEDLEIYFAPVPDAKREQLAVWMLRHASLVAKEEFFAAEFEPSPEEKAFISSIKNFREGGYLTLEESREQFMAALDELWAMRQRKKALNDG